MKGQTWCAVCHGEIFHIPPDLVVQPFVFHNSLEISIGTPMVCPELVQTI
jgi:hypothetical protein